MPELKKEFLTERQGKPVVLYAGLLDYGHQVGLKKIATQLLQSPDAENGYTAICAATVTLDSGQEFSGIGDANVGNVGKMIAVHIIRMSETRAKARALRDALNIGTVALEELADDDNPPAQSYQQPRTQTQQVRQPQRTPPSGGSGVTGKVAQCPECNAPLPNHGSKCSKRQQAA